MKKISLLLVAVCLLMSLAACSNSNKNNVENLLDPYNPVTLTVWHYYHGPQQNAFDSMVENFNNTKGLEKGIIVEAYSYGGVNDLADALMVSANDEIGSKPLPDIFSAYADSAFKLDNMQKLANIDDYISDDKISLYVDSYIEEGRINSDRKLKVFPVAKSSEIAMLNKTDFDLFVADSSGLKVSYNDLKTFEGISATAAKYYAYTDSKTPDIPNDGKAFFGLDVVANFAHVYAKQMNRDLIIVTDGKPSIGYDEELIRKIWDFYYVNTIKGYFTANGRFRSDDTKTGDLLYFIGSTAGAAYFPTQVTDTEGNSHDVELMTFSMPVAAGGKNIAIQQGAGMCISKSEANREYASVLFLEWFTQPDINAEFAVKSAGYNVVVKSAITNNLVQTIMKDDESQVTGDEAKKVYKNNMMVMKTFTEQNSTYELFSLKPFDTSTEVRPVFEGLDAYANAAAKSAKEEIAAGGDYYDVTLRYCSEEEFQKWYQAFDSQIKKLIE